ncbi:hypothetical protein OE88DRAFT_1731207 [Heliocybe sulcata]|uniref:DH domain-containing protein n=1 Tax=Heliocybe sulcata TaxID=5364 RepID=A0A5C3NEX9_9AGAM|nr:hypothetical protein OE88DRAFT_1731207 [Heliocybe sulcata]
MALTTPLRKLVPLSIGDDWDIASPNPSLTRRVFSCGVVLETYGSAKTPDEAQRFMEYLGENMMNDADSDISPRSSPATRERSDSDSSLPRPAIRKRALTNTSALNDLISELVSTERSYVARLKILKKDYADPLRSFAKAKDTMIIPIYEAKALFGNLDQIIPVNEAFLADLEDMLETGQTTGFCIGDVALKHFRDLHGFKCYKDYYANREDAQRIFRTETKRSGSQFALYIERTKYSSAMDMKNRVGLRELLMDPVQRIPRYTLLFRNMIKFMAQGDPQKEKLEEADAVASEIARAETDVTTKQALILHTLSMSIDGFPANLYASRRKFIDCVDVEETPAFGHGRGWSEDASGSGGKDALHCTLILFDDKLMVVKRSDGDKSGRALAGIDDLDKVAQGPLSKKKSGMVFKGMVEVSDVVATDVGGSDMHLFFEDIPQYWPERWAGRPFRPFTVVDRPKSASTNASAAEAAKQRFLENLWETQARYRARGDHSTALRGDEFEVEAKGEKGEKVTRARAYYNVYLRHSFLMEPKKTKVVLHVDVKGTADRLPFGEDGGNPLVVIRVQPMEGELCRYSVSTQALGEEGDEDIVQLARVPARIVQTIHQYGLFKFSTGYSSIPGTPTATLRSRAGIFGLDAISRGLFNVRPGVKSAQEIFASGHRRTKSATSTNSFTNGTMLSRASSVTVTASRGESSMLKPQRSNSNSTNSTPPTSLSSCDDEGSSSGSSKLTRRMSRKLMMRGKSPTSSLLSRSDSGSRSSRSGSSEGPLEYSDPEDEGDGRGRLDSARDLRERLELARHNSNQNQNQSKEQLDVFGSLIEDPVYEDSPPQPYRPLSRASKDVQNARSPTPTLRPESSISMRSPASPERRPGGPRSPPLSPVSFSAELPDGDSPASSSCMPERTSPLPRSKRMPFDQLINLEIPGPSKLPSLAPPKSAVEASPSPSSTVPLQIKKKTSVPSNSSTKPAHPRIPRLVMTPPAASTDSTEESVPHVHYPPSRIPRSIRCQETERLSHLAQTTKEDLESAHRAVRKLKIEALKRAPATPTTPTLRPVSLIVDPEAEKQRKERMEEVRKSIAMRNVPDVLARRRTIVEAPPSPVRHHEKSASAGDIPNPVDGLLSDIERYVESAMSKQDDFCEQFGQLKLDIDEDAAELEQTQLERQVSRRKNEVLKTLFEDTMKEKDVMYDQFNEELDLLSNSLAPAAAAIGYPDLEETIREVIQERKRMDRENAQLRWRMAQMEAEKEEYADFP